MKKWTAKSLNEARSQGWTIMQHGLTNKLMIAKVDDVAEPGDKVCFRWDEDAQEFVEKQARAGDPLAIAALHFITETLI